MTGFVVERDCGPNKEVDSRQEAEDAQDAHAALCQECDDEAKIVPVTEAASTDTQARADGGGITSDMRDYHRFQVALVEAGSPEILAVQQGDEFDVSRFLQALQDELDSRGFDVDIATEDE